MSHTLGLGITPMQTPATLLPITSSFALPLTAYFTLLSYRVVRSRLKSGISLDPPSSSSSSSPHSSSSHQSTSHSIPVKTHSSSRPSTPSTQSQGQGQTQTQRPAQDGTNPDPAEVLMIEKRSHANFTENVPLALILAALVEINGGNKKVLAGALGVFCVFRVLHVEFGMRVSNKKGGGIATGRGVATGKGRAVGWMGSLGIMVGLAGWGAYLSRSYWGL